MSVATSFIVILFIGTSMGCIILRPKKTCEPVCRPTCAYPNPFNCGPNNCPRGYIRSCAKGSCIRICDCSTSLGCNGDPNAMIQEYPPPCGPTCENPKPCTCNRPQLEVGCVCKPHYMYSEREGKCVAQCPAYC
ncbi:hypothetical protein evm_000730 [Chilo suppressalis]|nr:hypothetical protein evm_000730 [Chilo suppressalis]